MLEDALQNIINVDLNKEMKKSYIDYSMSVIVGRALPDVRDGLKPVHRRILYTMYEAGLTPDKPYKKCAATVGDVLGKYHPHGDAAVYDSLVRMAQDFSLRYPMVDGHGNFGSVDGDPPAAYRYTEAKMSKLSLEMLTDIEKDTVDFIPNYDENLKEPVVLPSRFPSLLVNGSSGIAVGMATNIPPHNLTEVINGIVAVIDNPEIDTDELLSYIKGPDFPTAGIIMGLGGIRSAYTTGRGKIIMRARTEIEQMAHDKERIVVTELPYQVNKARLIEKIAELVKDKRVDGISDIRDESDREGMRMVIELKRDANASVILNQLYKFTQLQDTFSINMLALVDNQPKTLSLREMLDHYIRFQESVIVRRSKYDLKKAEARAHILDGLRIALDNIDEIISIIRSSYNDAKANLMERFSFSDVQAQAILDMRLARLQGLEREKIDNEYAELMKQIEYLNQVLSDEHLVLDIVKNELIAIRDKYGDERRSEITAYADEINIEDLIDEEEVVITLTHFGYVKRLPVDTYKSQRRGGRGVTGITTREEDFVEKLFVTSTHNHILFFSSKGKMYRLKAYEIPEAGRQAKGTAIVNLLQLDSDEKITAAITLRQFEEGKYLFFGTKHGVVKKSDLLMYNTARKGGLAAIVLDEDDELINVRLSDGNDDIILSTFGGMCIRFNEADVRPMGRVSRGVRGIKLSDGDYVVGMSAASEGDDLLVVTENGFGKKTPLTEYKTQTRGGKGVTTYRISDATGNIAGITVVSESDDIMLITSEGVVIRMKTREISRIGRLTKGVRLMRLDDNVSVVSIARTDEEEDEETETVSPEETVGEYVPDEADNEEETAEEPDTEE
ncbi:DNA gyrase subunit A [Congzhengia minquanensis]|uniref:DNA gyrase subunit A n=1 Tax=Congzhengia minquanensis TaxID=2763657 RepID=A0A926HYK7_9FIRM|nr:DNA gyrase subunit A [Congzhengia minquanensis]MBC8539901.1 DNA gyrase subunit A [Congzhengia minquanensis]